MVNKFGLGLFSRYVSTDADIADAVTSSFPIFCVFPLTVSLSSSTVAVIADAVTSRSLFVAKFPPTCCSTSRRILSDVCFIRLEV